MFVPVSRVPSNIQMADSCKAMYVQRKYEKYYLDKNTMLHNIILVFNKNKDK